MRRVALKGLVARKVRAVLTALAIVLGVAMVSGTFVLTDTIDRAFHTIFTSSYEKTDLVVSGRKVVEESASGNATIPAPLLARVRTLPGVQDAAGTIIDLSGNTDQVKLLDRKGAIITASGNPTFGFGIDRDAARFNPFRLTRGRFATAPDEVVIDADTAASYHFAPGDTIRAAGTGAVRPFRVVGISKFGDVSSLGGATIAIFTVQTARSMLDKEGFDSISIAAKPGVAPQALAAQVQRLLPATAQVRTGEEQARADSKDISTFLHYVRLFLLGFAGVALFVGGFVIFNTLSITVAQRTREFATLRTLGASRRQLLRAVLLESFALGLGASLVGLALGIGIAAGLTALLRAAGLSLPQTALIFAPRTAIVSLLAGTGVTLAAGVLPALKATRVAPIAAVREGAVVGGHGTRGRLVGLVVGLLGAALLLHVALSSGGLLEIVLGTLLLFVGMSAIATRLVPGLVGIVGVAARRVGGPAGRLAARNAVRNPARTASTAAALMIGLALVTFCAVFARGLVGSDKAAVGRQVSADYVVQSANGWSTFPRAAEGALRGVPGATAAAVRYDRGLVGASSVDVDGVDPDVVSGFRFNWTHGSDATFRTLGASGAVVRKSFAKEHHLVPGSPFVLKTATGTPLRLTVAGIYDPPTLDQLPGSVIVARATFDRVFPHPQDQYLLVNGSTKERIAAALAPYPETKVFTRDEFITDRSAFIGKLLNMVYVLLALSVVVSLFGMINTLVLSVFERTRELGMLRAVGMTRRQARRMVRHESIITALIGASIGLPLGLGLAAVVIHRLSSVGVHYLVPWVSLLTFVGISVFAGVLAAVLPARKASRLDVLSALQYE
jgi:putative ABC transport system permease protein